MTAWTEGCLGNPDPHCGVILYNYHQEATQRLRVAIGDIVVILASAKDWYYGYNVKNKRAQGIFPKSYVVLKGKISKHSEAYGAITFEENPVVQEISSVLREWGVLWKELYSLHCGGDDNEPFYTIENMMRHLINWRKLILSHKLTVDEMRDVKQKVTNQIDLGNTLLGLDLIVRDEEGTILNPESSSTISLYRQHQVSTQRIRENDHMTQNTGVGKSTSFNLYVSVKNFVCRVGDDSDVYMSLYDAKDGVFISENYLLKWGTKGMPKDMDMLHNLRVIYTDLGQKDSAREKVFLVCQVLRIGRMDMKDADSKKQTHGLRRPFGVAALEITSIIKGLVDDEEKQHFVPFQQCGEKDFLDTVIKKVVAAKELSHKGQGLFVCLKRMDGDLKQSVKEHPHLVSNSTTVAHKMGFPDVIMPGDVRNDFYVTLAGGEFRRGNKTADKNVEVTMWVCDKDGNTIRDVIYEGAGSQSQSFYKSVIYYHEDRPKWNETIKIAIPLDHFYSGHLKFTFKHRSSVETKDRQEKPFAMSYIRLMKKNGTTLSDTDHELLVYKFDAKRNERCTMYLDLPSTYRELHKQIPAGMPTKQFSLSSGPLSLNTNDNFHISTLACSTKLTHNVDLMGLLKWRGNTGQLKNHLQAFMSVDGEEVVKFLQDTLDALFNILIQNSESDAYDDRVFDALVFILNLVSDRKYSQFRPVLDLYIKNNFSATLAYNKLMVVLKHYIENASDESRHPSLLKAMISLEYIFKLIVRSRVLFAALNESRGQQQFEISVKQVFQALNYLMSLVGENVQGIQSAVLKYLPSTITDLMSVFNPQEFSIVMIDFINSVPDSNAKLVRLRMLCINDIVHSELYRLPECRLYLNPVLLSHVKRLMDGGEEREICIKILSDIMDLLFAPTVVTTAEDMSTVSMMMLRTTIRTVIHLIQTASIMDTERRMRLKRGSSYSRTKLLEEQVESSQALLGNGVAVMTAILRQMKPSHYTEYINHFDTPTDLMDFLMEALMVFKDLVRQRVYPEDWNEMIMLQNSVFLKAIHFFSNTIRDRFTSPFEHQLWNNFFHCTIAFLTQDHLQLERFSTAKRNKVISRYGDMRREAGFEIRSMWYNLGQYKVQFIPDMVGPILEMTLLPEAELRKRTIPIFFDMMQCEFMSQLAPHSKHIKRNFHKFENEMVIQLDMLVEVGKGDMAYRDLFYSIIGELCDGHSTMRSQGMNFVEVIHKLLTNLLEYRDVIGNENREHQMTCIVNVLNFYHSIDRQEMYIRYLHKLAHLHLDCDNFTEAAHTLMLYVKLLQWSDEAIPVMLQDKKYPDLETHRELKEKLLYDIIDYLDKGKVWEKGIELCKELAFQYETEIFDYIKLSELLQLQASMYDSIMKAIRPEPEYFRVYYYGKGFPSFIQNKGFIFRGKEYERLSDFTARLQNHFPNALLMKTLSPPSEDIKDSDKQYLQVNAVTPIMELKHDLQNKKVHGQILRYYKVNEVDKFTYSRKRDEGNNDPSNLWLERTIMTTSHSFPGILRWFPIIDITNYDVSPLENAIETIEGTNQKIKALIDAHNLDPSLRVDPLGMVLNGVADAAVNGGITLYKKFYQADFLNDRPQKDHNLVKRLRHVTTMQLLLLQKGLDIHRRNCPENLMPFQAHMEQSFHKMRQFVEKEYNIQMTDDDRARLSESFSASPSPNKKRVQTMPPDHYGNGAIESQAKSKSVFHVRTALSVVSSTLPRPSTVRESPTRVYTRAVSSMSGPPDTVDDSPRSSTSPRASMHSAYTNNTHRGSSGTLSLKRNSQVIELDQQLTPQRPRRPDSRPGSAHYTRSLSGSYSPDTSTYTTMVNIDIDSAPAARTTCRPPADDEDPDYDIPPPLPVKHTSVGRASLLPGYVEPRSYRDPQTNSDYITLGSSEQTEHTEESEPPPRPPLAHAYVDLLGDSCPPKPPYVPKKAMPLPGRESAC